MNGRSDTQRELVGSASADRPGGSVVARAMAAGIKLGQAHGPLIAEDDSLISVERVRLRRPDGVIDAYAAWPRAADAFTPATVVVMHAWGVDESMRDTVRRFARDGFVAIAPDLYGRLSAPRGDGQTDIDRFRPFAQRLDAVQVAGDIRAAALWCSTKRTAAKVGITGFSLGGAVALREAIEDAEIFSAASIFYAPIAGIDPTHIRVPIVGSFGERDPNIPADNVRLLRKVLRVTNDIRVYPTAGHAFFDDQRETFVSGAATDAWARTTAFFRKHLSTQQQF